MHIQQCGNINELAWLKFELIFLPFHSFLYSKRSCCISPRILVAKCDDF